MRMCNDQLHVLYQVWEARDSIRMHERSIHLVEHSLPEEHGVNIISDVNAINQTLELQSRQVIAFVCTTTYCL